MPKTVPTPVTAALGLVPTVLGGVRRLPSKAVQLPILALSSALNGMDLARREYDELSARGERLVSRLRGTSFDELEERVEDGRAVASVPDPAPSPDPEQPKGTPTPKATEPDSTRIDTAATAEVVAAVEAAASAVTVPSDLSADDLPLADYDHLTLGALRGRLRSLDVEQLVALRTYEKSKADRLPVVTMLDNRIAKLAAGQAEPSGGTAVATPSPKASAAVKPPKKVGAPAAAKNDAPPHTKVRHT